MSLTQDEASLQLNDDVRTFIKRLGSNYVSQIKWRSMWAFVVQRLESQSVVYGESLQQAAGHDSWGSSVHLYTTVKLLPAVHVKCNWYQSQENTRRREFCDKYEGYSNVCSCKHFYYYLWLKRMASFALNTPTRMSVRMLLFSYQELSLYFWTESLNIGVRSRIFSKGIFFLFFFVGGIKHQEHYASPTDFSLIGKFFFCEVT